MKAKKEYKTIKIFKPTAERLKKFVEKKDFKMAAFSSKAIDEAIKKES